ncbi:MAG TPA: class I SAM-dependent methyltransferase [Lentisphaeria bacterium]|nr:class I SAM-dependent methyltransferase [Lentisphaeria bacterium]
MTTYTEISQCRICGGADLRRILSLGQQALTGVFPKSPNERVSFGPLDLVWCAGCSLLQLKQSYNADEMYGQNYGYRSGLNQSMVRHLENKTHRLEERYTPSSDDTVIDIGSNDATSLKAYRTRCRRVGVDPTGNKFRRFYPDDIMLIPDFFSAGIMRQALPGVKAKIITAIAMFYDLESPQQFIQEIAELLAEDGVWHFEQSYMPSMLKANSYDTICHEHLEFYSFTVVKNLLEDCGLRVIDVETNAVNGGSFAVTACLKSAPYQANEQAIAELLAAEDACGLDTEKPYRDFARRVFVHRDRLKELLQTLRGMGKTVLGYGASTKGNVLLQFCGLGPEDIPCIAEVNPDKFGCYTPGTQIPIVSEAEAHAMRPDYFLVLPWHFRETILEREQAYRASGGKMIFPLPDIDIV